MRLSDSGWWRSGAALAAGLAMFVAGSGASAAPRLHTMFQDHAVLQRDQPIEIWGQATPGEEVTVTLGAASASIPTDIIGRWYVTLPPMPAGGPHVLTVRSADGTHAASDVLIGDVWLCSGQSNMEMPVSRTMNGADEAARSSDERIRLLKVEKAASPSPRHDFLQPPTWKVAAPEPVAGFSASCFYMARELRKTIDVPMGLIDSSWGGSWIQPWISREGLIQVGDYNERLVILREHLIDPAKGYALWGEAWQRWWRQAHPAARGPDPWSANPAAAAAWARAPGARPWESWGVPELANFDGLVWLRTSVDLTADQARRAATVSLGEMDDTDQVWVNGRLIGSASAWIADRVYTVPPKLLKPGRNEIAVAVYDTWGPGGFHGKTDPALRFAGGAETPLRDWRYMAETSLPSPPPPAPWEPIAGLSTMYNAMIAPLGRTRLKGIAWYQGESNTGEPERYQRLLSALMKDWRRGRSPDTAFLVVELANYGVPPTAPAESGWAALRDAQRRAAEADPHAAAVVTIDVGDRYDIHPANKQEVGRRLARAARHVAYREAVPPSGPRAVSGTRHGGDVVVRFADVEGALVAYSGARLLAFELCGAGAGSCRFAEAEPSGDRVTLAGDGRAATRVRFCWADSPVCNLYDRSGLPAGPFELPIE